MISFSAIVSFLRKEFLQILRSREMLVMIFVFPIVELLFLGFAVSNEVRHVRLAFLDYDRSAESRELVSAFSSTDRFDIVPAEISDTPYTILQSWRAQAVVVIPAHFGRDLNRLDGPALQIVLDGVDGNTTTISSAYCSGIIQSFIRKELKSRDPRLLAMLTGQTLTGGVDLRHRMWFNPDLRSSLFIIPGIVAVLVTITSMLLSAMSLVREKEIGTLEQLMVTPVSKIELLIGKLVPFWLISFVQMAISLVFAFLIFGVRPTGNIPALFLFSNVYLFTTLGLGIFISTWSSSQQQAMFFAWFCMVFMLLLGGMFIPVANMPAAIRAIAAINPMNHFMVVVRELVIKGAGFHELHNEFLILLAFGTVCLGGSVIAFRKRV